MTIPAADRYCPMGFSFEDRSRLKKDSSRKAVNIVLALMLVFTAAGLSGVMAGPHR